MPHRHRLTGTTMIDGYIQDLMPKTLTIEIDDAGRIWDAGDVYHLQLHVTDDGQIRGWATVTFSPDAGELARVGLLPRRGATSDA